MKVLGLLRDLVSALALSGGVVAASLCAAAPAAGLLSASPVIQADWQARCHCRRGFAIIAPSIPLAVALIAPTIAGSSTSSTIAPNYRLAAAASALDIAIGGDFYVVIHDGI